MPETFVIVGAGLAGIGADSNPPYERPPLSKDYHRSESSLEQALVQPPGFYGENGIETRFGVRATRVDATEKVVEIDGAMPPRLEPGYP